MHIMTYDTTADVADVYNLIRSYVRARPRETPIDRATSATSAAESQRLKRQYLASADVANHISMNISRSRDHGDADGYGENAQL